MAMFGRNTGAPFLDPQTQQAVTQYASMPAQPAAPKRWMDGGKFTTRDAIGLAVGAIGDAFTGQNNISGMVTGAFNQRRQLAMLQAQQAQKRQADWEDWQRQYQYELAHPKPANNDTQNDYGFIQQHLGQGAADQYLRNLGDPMVTVPLPNGSIYSGPRSGMGSALGGVGQSRTTRAAPAPGTIEDGYRFKGGNPADPSAWEPIGAPSRNSIPSGNPLDPNLGRY